MAQEWTITPPTVSGWYWIYIPNYYSILKDMPDKSLRACVDVYIHPVTNEIQFEIFATGYEWEPDISPANVTHWLGPLPVPALPVVVDGKRVVAIGF